MNAEPDALISSIRDTELDRTRWPEFLHAIDRFGSGGPIEARSYPGYPSWPLETVKPRLWPSLDRTLARRRSPQDPGSLPKAPPLSRRTLSRLLLFGHGIHADHQRGPVPSAGGLQALELYLVWWGGSWLPSGLYHYDRPAHALHQIEPGASADVWLTHVPSLRTMGDTGSLLWVLVGDGAKTQAKYGPRGLRFLLLEAGHLMQNLCVLSASQGRCTVPLGGYFENDIARAFRLPADDHVLSLGSLR
jgi:SagB-type dehydrogenase family enzyme